MNVLALDPGQTTGACLIRTAPTDKGFQVLWIGEVPWEERFPLIHRLIRGGLTVQRSFGEPVVLDPPEILVMEMFRLRQGRAYEQSGSEMPSSQVIGIAQAFCWIQTNFGTPCGVVFQEPGIMSRVMIPDEDVAMVRGSPHMQDAYRHARYFYLMNLRGKDGTTPAP